MPIPSDLALLLFTAITLGLGLSMLVSQAIGGAIGTLIADHRDASK